MEIISNIALISINETLIAELVSFLIFLYVINKVMFKPLRSVIDERNDHIEGMQKEIIDAEQRLDDVKKILRDNEMAVKDEAFSVKTELESAGDQQASEIFNEVKIQIDDLRKKGQAKVQTQLDEAKKSMQKEADALVVQIMEKVLERRLA